MKILVPMSTLDLTYRLGCTPSWWQLLKALHETGNEVIAVPYLGDPVETLWWSTYPNPCSFESKMYNRYLDRKKSKGNLGKHVAKKKGFAGTSIDRYIRNKWTKHIKHIMEKERDIDAVLFMNIPLNHITGISSSVKKQYDIPVCYFDGDMPTILPKYASSRGFKFNYYTDADLSEFNCIFVNSDGVKDDLIEMGANKTCSVHYAIDPELFRPVPLRKKNDVSFFGYGSEMREEWIMKMITKPSLNCPEIRFAMAGGGFRVDTGAAEYVGNLGYSQFRDFCCSSKINLNITRSSHSKVFGSSTARPFELAGFGSCIISQPYNGLEQWFEPKKELLILGEEESAESIIITLLDDCEMMFRMANAARERVVKDHSYKNRAITISEHLG